MSEGFGRLLSVTSVSDTKAEGAPAGSQKTCFREELALMKTQCRLKD